MGGGYPAAAAARAARRRRAAGPRPHGATCLAGRRELRVGFDEPPSRADGRPGQCEHEGVQVREFSVPPDRHHRRRGQPDRPGLGQRRAVAPDAVQFVRRRRRTARLGGRDLPRSSATRWSRVARGLVAAGIAAGRPGRADEPHPLRVDAARLRDLGGRRGDRADLRDLQRRAGRSGSSPTPARSPCVVETDAHAAPGRRRPGPAARAAPRLADRRRAAVGRAGRRAARRSTAGRDRACAARAVQRRRPGHDHLHQRHHRPPQGLRADPPQHATPTSPTRCPVLAEPVPRRAPRPCCSCRWRTPSPGSSRSAWCRPGSRTAHCADTKNLVAELQAVPADLRARRAAGLREGLQRRPAEGRRPTARARSSTGPSRSRSPTARRWTTPAGPGLALRLQHAALRPAGLRQAAGRARRAVPRRDLRRRPARRPARPLLPRHRGDHLRGLRPDRDLARPPRSTCRDAHPDRHRRPAAARRRPSGSPTTARS